MKYTINVTEQNIKDAKMLCKSGHARARCCPVALAAKEAGMRSDLTVSSGFLSYPARIVGHDEYGYPEWKSPFFYPLTKESREFVEAFDLDQPVRPFSFELEVPDAEEGTPRP